MQNCTKNDILCNFYALQEDGESLQPCYIQCNFDGSYSVGKVVVLQAPLPYIRCFNH